MQRVDAVYARETQGVIAFRSHSSLRSSARIVQPDRVGDAHIVLLDGRVARIRGAAANDPAATESAAHQPYDGRYGSEYRLSPAPCADCTAGTVAIAYDALSHDALHAHGIVVIDTGTARVVRTTTIPYVVPAPARSGSLATTWGPTPAGWLPLSTTGTFSGRVGPFSGHATLTQTFDEYIRYANLAAALR